MNTFPMYLQMQGCRDVIAAIASRLRDSAKARLFPPVAAQKIKQAIDTVPLGEGSTGSVALVGAGPGAKDLITMRGVQRLQEAEVIFYDRLIDPEILDLARHDAEKIYVGKAPGCHHWPQDKISGVLVASARQGKRVVRLKCGDPGVFARGAEEADALNAAGIPFEVVPGVTAASAASAALGGFLTERGTCDTLVFATGQSEIASKGHNWLNTLKPGTRVAVYMGVGSAARIAKQVVDAGLERHIEIDIVSRAQQKDQVIAQCRASTLVETIKDNAISNPAILFLTWPHSVAQVEQSNKVVQLR